MDMLPNYSSGDEVLEIGPQGITVLDWDASVRQYTWHKQEAKPLSLEETLWLRISHELYPEGLEYDLMRRAETNDTRAARLLDTLPWRRLDLNYEIIGNSVKREECDNGNK